jgi:hypothetical protein
MLMTKGFGFFTHDLVAHRGRCGIAISGEMRALKPDGICGRFRVGEEAAPEPQDRVRLPILRLPIGEPINMASKMPSVWRRAKTGVSNSRFS